MSRKELTAFRVAPELMEAMREVKAREGIPISVQMDFALRAWLKKKTGLTLTATSRRAGTRRKV